MAVEMPPDTCRTWMVSIMSVTPRAVEVSTMVSLGSIPVPLRLTTPGGPISFSWLTSLTASPVSPHTHMRIG